MYKIIGADGKEYGPITVAVLRLWIAEGRVNGQTMVQPAGATDWLPAAAVPELAALLPGNAPPVATGAAPLEPVESILARAYTVNTSGWISAAWELVKAHFGLLIGASLVVFLLQGAAQAVPFIGGIAGMIVGGPLYGGLYWLNLRLIRGEPGEFADAFAGFNRAFVQLMLVQIIVTLLVVVALIPGAIGIIAGLAVVEEHSRSIGTGVIVVGGVLAAAGLVVMIYLTVCWLFALALVVDRQMEFWPAMKLSRAQVRKNWWGIFGFMIVTGLVVMLGVLLCCVGLIVTMPIAIAAMMYAYEDLFGRRPAATA